MLCDHAALDVPLDDITEVYEADIITTMWVPGGDDADSGSASRSD